MHLLFWPPRVHGIRRPQDQPKSLLRSALLRPLPSHIFQGDPKNDLWIFALSVLLSSTFIYNSMITINHQALEQLQSHIEGWEVRGQGPLLRGLGPQLEL